MKLASGTVPPKQPSLRQSVRITPPWAKKSNFIGSSNTSAFCRRNVQITSIVSISEHVFPGARISGSLPANVEIGLPAHAMDARPTLTAVLTSIITISY